jgi:hypothetical protein
MVSEGECGVRKSGARKFSGGTHGSHIPRQSGEEAMCIGSCCLLYCVEGEGYLRTDALRACTCALFCGDVTCLSLYETPSLGNVYGSGVE